MDAVLFEACPGLISWLLSPPLPPSLVFHAGEDFTEFIYTKICMGLFEDASDVSGPLAREPSDPTDPVVAIVLVTVFLVVVVVVLLVVVVVVMALLQRWY